MDKTFIEKLTAIKESYNSKDFDTLKNELNAYKEIIPTFFSRNGESSGIRSMYEKVNDPTYNKKNINVVDLNITESIYDDYLNGMYTFIQDLNTVVTTESASDAYDYKLKVAKENDPLFIESIFGGQLNEEVECSIKEAADNLEILINFIPKIDTFYNRSLILSESMKSDSPLVKDSIEMICESVSNYSYNIIKNVMNTYYSIMDTFNESEGTVKEEKFVLL